MNANTNMTVVGVDLAKNVFQVHYVDEETGEIINKALSRKKFESFGRGMQKRNFDSELKSLNDKPSNQASICKATSSPKLNGVF